MLIFAPGGCAAAEDAVAAVVGGNVQVTACCRDAMLYNSVNSQQATSSIQQSTLNIGTGHASTASPTGSLRTNSHSHGSRFPYP